MSIKGQGHSLTLVKDHSDFKVNTCSCVSVWENGNDNLNKRAGSHDQDVKTCFSQKQLGDLEPKFI